MGRTTKAQSFIILGYQEVYHLRNLFLTRYEREGEKLLETVASAQCQHPSRVTTVSVAYA